MAVFAILESNDEWAKSKVQRRPCIGASGKRCGKPSIYRGDWSIPSIAEFFQGNLLTVVPNITISNVGKLGGKDVYLVIAVVETRTRTFLSEFRRYTVCFESFTINQERVPSCLLDANKRYQVAFSSLCAVAVEYAKAPRFSSGSGRVDAPVCEL